MKKLPIIENVEITGVAAEGKSLARVPVPSAQGADGTSECVLFVPMCVPGDVVDVQVTKKKHSFMEGRVERYVSLSDIRCAPRCKHFGECGGCKWQMLPYEEQLRYKQQQVADNLTRIGKLPLPEMSPILGSKHIYEYRNKLEFSCSDKKWVSWDAVKAAGGLDNIDTSYGIGFHITGAFDKVLDIEECHLMSDINNEIRNSVRKWAKERGLTFYNERTHTGWLRSLILRSNIHGEMMLTVVFAEKNDEMQNELLRLLHEQFTEIKALLWVLNTKFNDTINDLEVNVFYGADHIIEEMEDLHFKVGPKSFYQTNTEQAYELYKVVRGLAFAGPAERELPVVYDLYTGTGTIAQFVAAKAKKVIGIEYVPEAIEDAKENARLNGINNCLFFAGDMKRILTPDFISQHGRPDIIITDPPRAGMDEEVVQTILAAAPERIVYVSCNPATQARDLAMLCGTAEDYADGTVRYRITAVQPVDMFPHTQHVENVVALEKIQ